MYAAVLVRTVETEGRDGHVEILARGRDDHVIDADHEAGDLLQARLDVSLYPTLQDVVRQTPVGLKALNSTGAVFFKSCGWAGWDLAAVRCWNQGMSSTRMR